MDRGGDTVMAVEAGAVEGALMGETGDWLLKGDEGAERSVTGVRSANEARSNVGTSVLIFNVVGCCGCPSERRKTFGEAERTGGAKSAGSSGFGGNNIDCIRSFRLESSSERALSVPSSGVLASFISCSMSSKSRPDWSINA